jgi:four helix bundle protein
MMMTLEGLNRLQVYQAAQELAQTVYREVITNLPSEEKWGLNSQIRRAAASVPANIAEGYGRYYYQETVRFCYLARGSLMELSSHFDLAHSEGYISDKTCQHLEEMMDSVLKLIHGYIKYLRQSKHGMNEPGYQLISEESFNYTVGNRDTVEGES